MKKILNFLVMAGFGLFSFIGLPGNSVAYSTPSISTITATSPLYLQKDISSQQQAVKSNAILAQNHYSHSSHYSHASHHSHYSSRY